MVMPLVVGLVWFIFTRGEPRSPFGEVEGGNVSVPEVTVPRPAVEVPAGETPAPEPTTDAPAAAPTGATR
jgi:hypothetical protein